MRETARSRRWYNLAMSVAAPTAEPLSASGPASVPAAAEAIGPTDWQPPAPPVPWRHPLAAMGWLIQMAAGTAAIALLMALAAAIPLANFYVLGYLIDASGRAARGRVRDAFWLWGAAPRLGTIFIALWLTLAPIRFLAGMAEDALVIDPASPQTALLNGLVKTLAVLAAGHLLLALARGGRARHFLWPIGNLLWVVRGGLGRDESGRGWYARAVDECAHLVAWIQPGRLWWVGVRGFLGALAWIALPATIYAAIDRPQTAPLLLLFLPLAVFVFCRLPFLQVRFATEDRLNAYLAARDVRRLFGFAPWSWLLAVAVLYVLTLPLYLTKIVLPPADAAWLATTVFVVSIFPTKLVLGWAYGRAVRLRKSGVSPSRWWSRWLARLLMAALVLAYVGIVFVMKYVCEHGRAALFETHAFLLPWPF